MDVFLDSCDASMSEPLFTVSKREHALLKSLVYRRGTLEGKKYSSSHLRVSGCYTVQNRILWSNITLNYKEKLILSLFRGLLPLWNILVNSKLFF